MVLLSPLRRVARGLMVMRKGRGRRRIRIRVSAVTVGSLKPRSLVEEGSGRRTTVGTALRWRVSVLLLLLLFALFLPSSVLFRELFHGDGRFGKRLFKRREGVVACRVMKGFVA